MQPADELTHLKGAAEVGTGPMEELHVLQAPLDALAVLPGSPAEEGRHQVEPGKQRERRPPQLNAADDQEQGRRKGEKLGQGRSRDDGLQVAADVVAGEEGDEEARHVVEQVHADGEDHARADGGDGDSVDRRIKTEDRERDRRCDEVDQAADTGCVEGPGGSNSQRHSPCVAKPGQGASGQRPHHVHHGHHQRSHGRTGHERRREQEPDAEGDVGVGDVDGKVLGKQRECGQDGDRPLEDGACPRDDHERQRQTRRCASQGQECPHETSRPRGLGTTPRLGAPPRQREVASGLHRLFGHGTDHTAPASGVRVWDTAPIGNVAVAPTPTRTLTRTRTRSRS